MRRAKHAIGLLLAGSLLLVPIGMAQPDRQPGGQTPADQSTTQPPEREARRGAALLDDPEAIQKRLKASIERGERVLARQREALERLESGESPGEVMRTLRVIPIERTSRERPRPDEASAAREPRRPADGRALRPSDDRPERIAAPTPEELRAFLQEHLPTMHTQLLLVEQTDQTAGQRLFERLAPRLTDLAQDMRRDERLGNLRVAEMRAGLAVVDASQQFGMLPADADDDAKASAETALRDAIGARFDAGVNIRQYEVEHLVARIGELNDEILAEIATRDAEVERVFQEIVRRKGMRRNARERGRTAP